MEKQNNYKLDLKTLKNEQLILLITELEEENHIMKEKIALLKKDDDYFKNETY